MNRDSTYEVGRSPATDDHTNESISSSRINGQISKNGAAATGNCTEGRGATSVGDDSGLSSLSSSECNKSGSITAPDSKVYIKSLQASTTGIK